MKATLPSAQQSPSGRLVTAIIYSLFLLTGTAVVLPGMLLPLLSRHWKMGDGEAGVFFLCFSVGSSAGALLARGKLARALTCGCLLVAGGAALLATSVAGVLLPIAALYGCGLGLAMTSISLMQSRRWPMRRIPELARLNLAWALGATAAPVILLRLAVRFGTSAVLDAVAGIFLGFAVLVCLLVPGIARTDDVGAGGRRWFHSLRVVPPVLLFTILLTTGVESGLTSWLSSYLMRAGYVLGITISATTAFGVGIVLSRLYHSRRNAGARSAAMILRVHPVVMVAAIVVLIFSHSPMLSVMSAFFAGVGIGPMYPLTLALQLNYKEAGNAGFLLGGIGASVVPMITGEVSSWTHSLRIGVCVPLTAATLILLLGMRMRPATS
jgi:fucose permease